MIFLPRWATCDPEIQAYLLKRVISWSNQLGFRTFFFFFFLIFIYLFLAVLGLRFCARALPSRGKRGPLFIAVRGPPTIAAPPAAEHRLQTRRPSNRGSRAQPLRGMRDPPRPGLQPASPASPGRLSTTAPPGKPRTFLKQRVKSCIAMRLGLSN